METSLSLCSVPEHEQVIEVQGRSSSIGGAPNQWSSMHNAEDAANSGTVLLPEVSESQLDSICHFFPSGDTSSGEISGDGLHKLRETRGSPQFSPIKLHVKEEKHVPPTSCNGHSVQRLPSFENTFCRNDSNGSDDNPCQTNSDYAIKPLKVEGCDELVTRHDPNMSPLDANPTMLVNPTSCRTDKTGQNETWVTHESALTRPNSFGEQNRLSLHQNWNNNHNHVQCNQASGLSSNTLSLTSPLTEERFQSLSVSRETELAKQPTYEVVGRPNQIFQVVNSSDNLNNGPGTSQQTTSPQIILTLLVSNTPDSNGVEHITPVHQGNVIPNSPQTPSPLMSSSTYCGGSSTQNLHSPGVSSSFRVSHSSITTQPTCSPSTSPASPIYAFTPVPANQLQPASCAPTSLSIVTWSPTSNANQDMTSPSNSSVSSLHPSDCFSPTSPYDHCYSQQNGMSISRSTSGESVRDILSPTMVSKAEPIHSRDRNENNVSSELSGYRLNQGKQNFSFVAFLNDPQQQLATVLSTTSQEMPISPQAGLQIVSPQSPVSPTWTINNNVGLVPSPDYNLNQFRTELSTLPAPTKSRKSRSTNRNRGNQIFRCEMCGREFDHSIGLKNHERSHRQDRNHSCRYCDAVFHYKTHLRRHERIHAKEMHMCRYCGETQQSDYDLVQHEREHRRGSITKPADTAAEVKKEPPCTNDDT